MSAASKNPRAAERVIRAYHRSSGLDPERPSRTPSHMVRASEPNPFRRYAGAELLDLPPIHDARVQDTARPPLDLAGIGRLLGDALALSAWKAADEARFGLRVVPSAGNLHPIETYVLATDLEGVGGAGAYHYSPFDHALACRQRFAAESWSAMTPTSTTIPTLLIGLSAILWRSAWKYGERAFRLVHLDAGHALAALSASAALVGWRLRVVPATDEAIERLLGIGRAQADLPPAERETAVALAALQPIDAPATLDWSALLQDASDGGAAADAVTAGRPTPVSPRHRLWPRAAAAVRVTRRRSDADAGAMLPMPELEDVTKIQHPRVVLRDRRSRGRFDPAATFAARDAATVLGSVPRTPKADGIAPLLFVHRVEGWPGGLYAATDGAGPLDGALRAAMRPDLAWTPFAVPAAALGSTGSASTLQSLATGDARRTIGHLAGGQDAAADAAMVFLFLGALDAAVARHGPWAYRWLHWRAGAAGHALYLAAEALQLGATGLSGFYDDRLCDFLGLDGGRGEDRGKRRWVPLYMLAVGTRAAPDPRLLPADAHRQGPTGSINEPVPPSRGGWRPV